MGGRAVREFRELHAKISSDIFFLCKLFRFTPTFQQAEVLRAVQAGYKRIAVKSGQGVGKCLPLSTSFYNASMGIRQTLKDAVGASFFKIPSMTDTEQIKLCDAHAVEVFTKPCVRVAVDSGQEIELSTDHPIYTPKGWVHAAKLSPGDLVATPRRLPAPESELQISDSEVRFVAALLCDGSTTDKVAICHLPGKCLDLVLEDALKLGLTYHQQKSLSKAHTYAFSNALSITRRWGLYGKLSKEKTVPSEFYGLSDRQLGEFFRVIFGCDGYVTEKGFDICLASKAFILDIQTLLLRFGVHSYFRYKLAKCQTGSFDCWVLNITGRENVLNFIDCVNIPYGREIQTETMVDMICSAEENTNVDIVPIQKKEVAEMMADCGIVSRRGRNKIEGKGLTNLRNQFRGRNTSYWSRNKLQQFCKEMNYTGPHSIRATNDIFWAKVESVVEIGNQEVVDLCVPETGNFVAQNFIVHNSSVSVIVGIWKAMRSYKAMVVVTAPTMKQCRDIWLKECRLWMSRADPLLNKLIRVTKTKVELFNDDDWGVFTVTASREENAQGYHEDTLTVIAEEASGIPPEIITTFKGTLTNDDSLLILIGNPNSRDCEFFNCFNRQRHEWKCITFNAEDTARAYAATPFGKGILRRNEALAKEFGRDSNVYRVRVLGEFPHTDPNTVMSSEEIEHCTGDSDLMFKHVLTKRQNGEKIKQFGLDFARFGGDENVFFRRQGNAIVEWKYFVHTEPKHLVNYVFMSQKQAGWSDADTIFVPDANGMGEGMMIEFHERGKRTIEFKAQMCPADDQYDNIITEAWFNLRKLVRAKNCYIPNDNQLIQQLSGRQYYMTNKGKIAIESKDDYKKRHENQSPDRADALVMAFYDQVYSTGHIGAKDDSTHTLGVKVKKDY